MRGRLDLLERHGLGLERDPGDDRRAGAAAGRGRVPRRPARADAGRVAVGHVRRVRRAADGPARPADDPVPQPGGRRRPHRRLPPADGRPEAPRRRGVPSLGYRVLASGDSYNDVSMLLAADAGFLFRVAGAGQREFPQLPAFETYDELTAASPAARVTRPAGPRTVRAGVRRPRRRGSGGSNGSVRRATLQ